MPHRQSASHPQWCSNLCHAVNTYSDGGDDDDEEEEGDNPITDTQIWIHNFSTNTKSLIGNMRRFEQNLFLILDFLPIIISSHACKWERKTSDFCLELCQGNEWLPTEHFHHHCGHQIIRFSSHQSMDAMHIAQEWYKCKCIYTSSANNLNNPQ